jgi:Cd2+/Zn2+-exporting ATPase
MVKKQKFIVEGMDCADCALTVERGVRKLPGVEKVELNFATTVLVVEGDVPPEALRQRVSGLGYQLVDAQDVQRMKLRERFLPGLVRYLLAGRETRLALAGGALIGVAFLLGQLGLPQNVQNGLQVLALALAGYPVARSAVSNLLINRSFSMNFLMTTAAVGAVIIGEIPEAASLIFLFTIAEALEGYTTDRARRSLGELAEMVPDQAIRLDGEAERPTPVADLRIGDRILTRAGERIAIDGLVLEGQSEVNQAPITGESLPAVKSPGDEVYAGTVNGSGALIIQVTHPVGDTTLSRIIRMVEQAQAQRAPTQRFVDRFARYYTPAMMVLAVLVAVIPPLIFGEPLLNQADGTRGWLYRGLAMLVIGCPCALVISTPVTIISAVSAAARRGVLFKGGAYLEALQRVKVIAFDKTGTLTRGVPRIASFRSVDCDGEPACAECDDVLALAAALERHSSHPLAQAVLAAAAERGLDRRYPAAEALKSLAGQGLEGQVNGQLATIGNHRLFDEFHPHEDELCEWVESAEGLGQTTMLVCDGKRVRGYLAVSDTLRPESAQVVRELKRSGKQVAMLTGDNPGAAQAVADQLGIDLIQAGLLPEGKVAAVRELQAKVGSVAMVGDGINDAPALAAASVGIAMGGAASAQAMETADVVLMGEDLTQLPFAIRLAKLAYRLILENVAFSIGIKLVFLALALGGWTTMWMAVLGDMGVSLLVTFNGMRPLAMGKRL